MIINNNPYNSQVNFGMKPPKGVTDVLKKARKDRISPEDAAGKIEIETGTKPPVADFRGVPVSNKDTNNFIKQ